MAANNGIEFGTPVGRLVGGGFELTQDTDDKGNPKFNSDGSPMKSMYLKLAIPKLINGAPNPYWEQMLTLMKTAAAQFWPQFWPQGPNGPCTHPRFTLKYADGDGTDNNGKDNKSKPGHAGHWILTIGSMFVPKCYVEGKFGAHEVLQDPDSVIKLGYWIRVIGTIKGNGADLSANQVPGISIYPGMVSFVGQGEEITFGINAEEAASRHVLQGMPVQGITGAPLGVPAQPGVAAAALPAPGALPLPTAPAAALPLPTPAAQPSTPQYTLSPAILALDASATVEKLLAQGWTIDAAVGAGHVIKHY